MAFPTPPSSRQGYDFLLKGGTIWSGVGGTQYAVFDVLKNQVAVGATRKYLVTLSDHLLGAPPGYQVGDNLTWNAKGTNNANANNALTVLEVVGSLRFICQGALTLNQ